MRFWEKALPNLTLMGPHYGDKIKSELFVALVTSGCVGWGILEAACGHLKGTSLCLWVCSVRECPIPGRRRRCVGHILKESRGESEGLEQPWQSGLVALTAWWMEVAFGWV